MPFITDETLQGLVTEIVRDFSPETIYLFGSRARGDARADSDADLLVIQREPFPTQESRQQELARLWRTVTKSRLPVEVFLYSSRDVEEWRATGSHLIGRALKEGRPLYAAE